MVILEKKRVSNKSKFSLEETRKRREKNTK